jgi:hypothetical protein
MSVYDEYVKTKETGDAKEEGSKEEPKEEKA